MEKDEAVQQPGYISGKHLVAYQLRDNLGSWSACYQVPVVGTVQYFVGLAESWKNDVVTIQAHKKLMQLLRGKAAR